MITVEKLNNHIAALGKRHKELDTSIQRRYARYESDETIKASKLEKLKLKQQIALFRKQLESLTQ